MAAREFLRMPSEWFGRGFFSRPASMIHFFTVVWLQPMISPMRLYPHLYRRRSCNALLFVASSYFTTALTHPY